MQIVSLRLENFRAFKKAELRDIPKFCVVLGANGTGKSSLFKVFEFLKDAMTTNVTTAVGRLGGTRGIRELRTRGSSGPVVIELKFRADLGSHLGERTVTYRVAFDEEPGARVVVTEEVLSFRRGERGKPWDFLKFSRGKGEAVTNELDSVTDERQLDRVEQTLKSPDILAIKGLAQFEKFNAVKVLGQLIENWHISDLHITKARPEQDFSFATHLSREGENLGPVIDYLHTNHHKVFETILRKMERRVPGVSQVEAKRTEEGRVMLKFRDGAFEDPFLARHVSDGTLRMLAYLVLLHDPEPHPLLCVEEPENQLYPKLLPELAEEFRAYSQRPRTQSGGQVFVSTHSPDFLNACKLDEVYYLVKKDGCTEIHRARDNDQIRSLMEQGDQLGALWNQGLFGEADPE